MELLEPERKLGEATEVKAYGFFLHYGRNRREQRLIALRHGPAIGMDKSEATISLEAARAERSAFERHRAACFDWVGVEFLYQH